MMNKTKQSPIASAQHEKTLRASNLELLATFIAELGTIRERCLAIRASHGVPRQDVEKER
jgi:hypothetical protein